MKRAVFGLAVISGCVPHKPAGYGLPLNAPAGIDGSAHVQVESDLQGTLNSSNVCDVRFDRSANLVPKDRIIEAGASAFMSVRPATYHVTVATCTGEKQEADLMIRDRTTIHFGYATTGPHVGTGDDVYIPFVKPDSVAHPSAQCIRDGNYSETGWETCCSPGYHYSTTEHRNVCGPVR